MFGVKRELQPAAKKKKGGKEKLTKTKTHTTANKSNLGGNRIYLEMENRKQTPLYRSSSRGSSDVNLKGKISQLSRGRARVWFYNCQEKKKKGKKRSILLKQGRKKRWGKWTAFIRLAPMQGGTSKQKINKREK